MNLYREHWTSELEFRWRKGECWLKRSNASGGFWQSSGIEVELGSLSAASVKFEDLAWLIDLGKELSREQFDSVRVAQMVNRRAVRALCITEYNVSSVYLELKRDGYVWSVALPVGSDLRERIDGWVACLQAYLQLPEGTIDQSLSEIVFSPAALGYLLHECIGHRMESDDHLEFISWDEPWTDTGFDVWDTPGKSDWLGYTPVGDDGTPGRPVLLLSGKTGDQAWLTKQSGSSRAASYAHHPLIRQRCLEVVPRVSTPPKYEGYSLFIDEIVSGSFDGETTELITSIQRVQDSGGSIVRLPSLRLRLNASLIPHLRVFGPTAIYHPPAGCGKNGQNQLPITFAAPSAWCGANAPIELFFA